MESLRFVMLRATQKQTMVEYQGQIAKNDDFYEDSSESSDYYTVKFFKEVIWKSG